MKQKFADTEELQEKTNIEFGFSFIISEVNDSDFVPLGFYLD